MRGIAILLVLLCGRSVGAQLAYNRACMEALYRDRITPIMATSKKVRTDIIFDEFVPSHAIDFEAAQDQMSGLEVTLEFAGSLGDAPRESLPADRNQWARTFATNSAVNVEYTPEAQKKLGEIYAEACHLIGRNCDYSRYTGMGRVDNRALSRREEWAIKWATFHALPDETLIRDSLDTIERKDIADYLYLLRRMRLSEARGTIFSVFTTANAGILTEKLVLPFVQRGFRHLNKISQISE